MAKNVNSPHAASEDVGRNYPAESQILHCLLWCRLGHLSKVYILMEFCSSRLKSESSAVDALADLKSTLMICSKPMVTRRKNDSTLSIFVTRHF